MASILTFTWHIVLTVWVWLNSPPGQEVVREINKEIDMKNHPILNLLLGGLLNQPVAPGPAPVPPGTVPVPVVPGQPHPLLHVLVAALPGAVQEIEAIVGNPEVMALIAKVVPGLNVALPALTIIQGLVKALQSQASPAVAA